MRRVIYFVFISVLIVAATIWIVLIGIAQSHCPLYSNRCSGPDLDIWMLPFFTAPVGGIAVLCLIVVGLARLAGVTSRPRISRPNDDRPNESS